MTFHCFTIQSILPWVIFKNVDKSKRRRKLLLPAVYVSNLKCLRNVSNVYGVNYGGWFYFNLNVVKIKRIADTKILWITRSLRPMYYCRLKLCLRDNRYLRRGSEGQKVVILITWPLFLPFFKPNIYSYVQMFLQLSFQTQPCLHVEIFFMKQLFFMKQFLCYVCQLINCIKDDVVLNQ